MFELPGDYHMDQADRLEKYFQGVSMDKALDIIELTFRIIEHFNTSDYDRMKLNASIGAEAAVEELNERFLEHGVGYRYVSGELVRVDSQFIHSEVVQPTLSLLSDSAYAGANAEFRKAFVHYRHGDTKECLNECLKAFESTMKAICAKREWSYDQNDTARKLIDILFGNQLLPDSIQSHLSSVRASLESGVPTIRNKFSGHGQGTSVVQLPPYYASYMLHLTATTIHFLAEAEKALP